MRRASVFVAATLVMMGEIVATEASATNKAYQLVVTEVGPASSLDPLDADNTNNLHVVRMLYATPVQTSASNTLASIILSRFSYDPATMRIEWSVASEARYDDGSAVAADDVALAVARMARARPDFPVISEIKGIKEWAQKGTQLDSYPEGLRVDGRNVTLQLVRDVPHPLFRFALELFAVIPGRCIDRKSGKLTCETPPSSGPYVIEDRSTDRWIFKHRESLHSASPDLAVGPERVAFVYDSPQRIPDLAKSLDSRTVIATTEPVLTASQLRDLPADVDVVGLAASRFGFVLLNPNIDPFRSQEARQLFADRLRQHFTRISGGRYQAEGSIFSAIVPGYVPLRALAGKRVHKADAKAVFKGKELVWGRVPSRTPPEGFEEALRTTATELGFTRTVVREYATGAELFSAHVKGESPFMFSSSGFWAGDPVGDLKMFFTPNLHKNLEIVAADAALQTLIDAAVKASQPKARIDAMEKVNEHLFDGAVFNPYFHFRRIFIAKRGATSKVLPSAITAPAPWQLFSQ